MYGLFGCKGNFWTVPIKIIYSRLQPGCKVSPLVWSNFFGQNADLTSGREGIIVSPSRGRHSPVTTASLKSYFGREKQERGKRGLERVGREGSCVVRGGEGDDEIYRGQFGAKGC